jgi:hypothetical protein
MTSARPRDRRYYQALRALGMARDAEDKRPAATDLETLIEQHQAPYAAPRARAWIAVRLRAWAGEGEENNAL